MAEQIPLDIISRLRGDERVERQLEDIAKKLDKLDKEQEEAADSAQKLEQRQRGLGGTLGSVRSQYQALTGIVGGVVALRLARWVADTSIEFERLETQLESVVDRGEDAGAIFSMLQDFSASTPFKLAELTQSYIGLRARGFEPTMETMRALGDLAGTFGKDFLTAMQAVSQAAFGEAEMLKQFGIIMRQEHDKVRILYKGTEQVVERESNAIFEHLIRLAQGPGISGGAERLAETVGGKLSTLSDKLDLLSNTAFKDQGGMDALAGLVDLGIALTGLQWDSAASGLESLANAWAQFVTTGPGAEQLADALERLSDADNAIEQALGDSAKLQETTDFLAELSEHVDSIATGSEEMQRLDALVTLLERQRELTAEIEQHKTAAQEIKRELQEHLDLVAARLESEEAIVEAVEAAADARSRDPIYGSGSGRAVPDFEVDFVDEEQILSDAQEMIERLAAEWARANTEITQDALAKWERDVIDEITKQFHEMQEPSFGSAFASSFGESMGRIGSRLGDAATQAIINGDLENFFDNIGSIFAAQLAGAVQDAIADALVQQGLSTSAAAGVAGFFVLFAAGIVSAIDHTFGPSNAVVTGFLGVVDAYGRETEVFVNAVGTFEDAAVILADAAADIRSAMGDVNTLLGGGLGFSPAPGSPFNIIGDHPGPGNIGGGGGGNPVLPPGLGFDFGDSLRIPVREMFEGFFGDLELVIEERGGEWIVAIVGVVTGFGDSLEAATQDMLDRFARRLPELIRTGLVTLDFVPEALIDVLVNSGAQTFDQLMEALRNASDVFLASLGPIEGDVFAHFSELGASVQQAVADGLSKDVALESLINQTRDFFSGIAGVNLFPVLADVDAVLLLLEERLAALGLTLEDLPGIADAAAHAVELFNQTLLEDVFTRLLTIIERIPEAEEDAARIRAELAEIQFRLDIETVRIQAATLRETDAITKRQFNRIMDLLDRASAFADSFDFRERDGGPGGVSRPTPRDAPRIEIPDPLDVRVVEDETALTPEEIADIIERRRSIERRLVRERQDVQADIVGGETGDLMSLLFDQKRREEDLRRETHLTNKMREELALIATLELREFRLGLEESIRSVSSLGAARESVLQTLRSINDMRRALLLLAANGEDVTEAMKELAEQEAQLRAEMERDLASQLFSFFEGTEQYQEEIAELREAERIAQLEMLRVQLEALGVFEQYRDVWEDALDVVVTGLDDVTTAVSDLETALDALRKSQDDALLGQSSPLSSEQRLFVAQRRFNDIFAAVEGGDLSRVQELIGARSTLLDVASGFGSGVLGTVFARTFRSVEDLIAQLDADALEQQQALTQGVFSESAQQTRETITSTSAQVENAIIAGNDSQAERDAVVIQLLDRANKTLGDVSEQTAATAVILRDVEKRLAR